MEYLTFIKIVFDVNYSKFSRINLYIHPFFQTLKDFFLKNDGFKRAVYVHDTLYGFLTQF